MPKRKKNEISIEKRLDLLEKLVLETTINLRTLAMFTRADPSDRRLEDRIRNSVRAYEEQTYSPIIQIPEKFEEVKFYREAGPKKDRRRIPIGIGPLSGRVTAMLIDAGYERLQDLHDVSVGEIFMIPGFGPASCREFSQFIAEFLR